MKTSIMIGATPWGEDCAQTVDPNYGLKAYAECKAFLKQLKRHYSEKHDGAELPKGLTLKVVETPYECAYGAYVTVHAVFDDEDEAAVDAAYEFEGNGPEEWDEAAKAELGLPDFSFIPLTNE